MLMLWKAFRLFRISGKLLIKWQLKCHLPCMWHNTFSAGWLWHSPWVVRQSASPHHKGPWRALGGLQQSIPVCRHCCSQCWGKQQYTRWCSSDVRSTQIIYWGNHIIFSVEYTGNIYIYLFIDTHTYMYLLTGALQCPSEKKSLKLKDIV